MLLHHGQPLISPVVTKLNVFTSTERTNTVFVGHGQLVRKCVACELLAITNSGENKRCNSCSSFNMMADFQQPVEEPEEKLGPLKPNLRCSACELSALINLGQPTKCPTCNGSPPMPETPTYHKENHVTRSRAHRTVKLPLSALQKLQAWLDANQHDPYPSAEVKKQLAQECGITEKQVATWFTNARARRLSPVEAWLSSTSEEDTASESDIVDATQEIQYSTPLTQPPDSGKLGIHGSRASSISGSSAYTAFSHHSMARRSGPSRRGKKKNYRKSHQQHGLREPPTSSPTTPLTRFPRQSLAPPPAALETWQCTFCLKHLSPRAWRRHEETQHLPRVQWSCMLSGPRLSFAQRGDSYCAFCMAKDPTDEHLATNHRISECVARPLADRTFLRPDHLRQHVKNYHNAALFPSTTAQWKCAAEPVESGWVCGFCGQALGSWDVREMHIAGHFRDGATMAEWKAEGEDGGGGEAGRQQQPEARGGTRKGKAPRFAASPLSDLPPVESSTAAYGSATAYERMAPPPPPPPPLPPLPPFESLATDVLADTAGNLLDAEQVPDEAFGGLPAPCTFSMDAWSQLQDCQGTLDGQWGYDEFMEDASSWNGI